MKLKPNNDLGLQRAEAIKNVLMDFGVHNSAVETVSERSDNVHFINNQLVDGIEFTISDAPQTSFQALNLYFPIKSYQFKITDELESYFTNLKKFLSKNATAKLNVYAYADDEFKQDENSKIRAKRLTYLKNVLKNRDFKLTQFQFQMGSQKPMIEQNSNILKTQRIEIRLATP